MIDQKLLRFALPKGRMYDGVVRLLTDAGIAIQGTSRGYRPRVGLDGVTTKILKPRAIVEMLAAGSRDLGFAGADWVADAEAELVELVDTRLDPVRLVAAMPKELVADGRLPTGPIVVASEYENLTRRWIAQRGLDAAFVRSYGATEVLPPEDADCIVDNTATGSTLAANGLEIVDELMRSSTRLYASPRAMEDPQKRETIEWVRVLVSSVLEARKRVMVEVNVAPDKLAAVVDVLPCMRQPTIATMHGTGGYAVKAAVPRDELARAIPLIKARGGTDIVVTTPEQIVL